jgi:hypothetical protein
MMVSFFSQAEEKTKKKTKKKKTHREEENVEKRGSLTFFSHFCIWDEVLFLPSPLHLPQALCLMPPRSYVLLKLGSFPKLWRWSEQEMR